MARPFRWHYTPADLNNYLQTPRRMTPDELTAVTTRSDPPHDNHRPHSALGYQPPASYAAATPTKPTLTLLDQFTGSRQDLVYPRKEYATTAR